MSYEAMCHAGYLKKDILVVLNDNEMSISPNVGALNKYLTRILSNKTLSDIKAKGGKFLNETSPLKKLARKIKENAQNILSPGQLFEELGFSYYGPTDGHDIRFIKNCIEELKGKERANTFTCYNKKR
jgi:1-deoxy-D-xylulose-5-phosphate synthase